MYTLRSYQEDALRELFVFWRNGGGNPLIAMATGTGKAVVIAFLIKQLLTDYPGMRVLVTAPNRELLDQDIEELHTAWADAPIGVNCDGLSARDTEAQILFATVNSIFRNPQVLGARHLIIVDESHLIPHGDDGMYHTTIGGLRELVPDLRVAGLTATPFRLDSGHLCEGDGHLFDNVVYEYSIAEGIRDGWLSPLSSKTTAKTATIDVTGVGKRGGEYIAEQLEAAAIRNNAVELACDEIATYQGKRRAWLVYCVGVVHTGMVRDALRARGVNAEMVLGETPSDERDRIIEDFRAGRLTALVSVMVLSYGFNVPHVDLIAMLRPTCSAGLYAQQVGRGTRKAEGKSNCLVLDFAGNVRRFGPVDTVSIKTKNSGYDSAPTKVCPECQEILPLAATECSCCGYRFTRDIAPKHAARADTSPILSLQRVVSDWMEVEDITYTYHHKKTPSLRVTYQCGVHSFSRWICLEHRGYARDLAAQFWRVLSGGTAVPATVDEALQRQDELEIVTHIRVAPEGERYWRIISFRVAGVTYDANMNHARVIASAAPPINDSIPY
jgi:DNA repair protein RadD